MTCTASRRKAAFLPMAYPLLKKGALGLFPKGQDVASELTEAAKYWKIQSELVGSRTDGRAQILVVKDLEPQRSVGIGETRSSTRSKARDQAGN